MGPQTRGQESHNVWLAGLAGAGAPSIPWTACRCSCSTETWALFRAGAWELGRVRGDAVMIGGEQVVGSRAAAIDSPAGGATVDSEARLAINAILGALREHGLIEI